MESEMQAAETNEGLDDHFISLLGGLSIGAVAWAVALGGVAIIKTASTDGINLLETLESMKLVGPPGIDLSTITIKLPELPDLAIVDISLVAVPILIGLVVAWISYRKVLKLN